MRTRNGVLISVSNGDLNNGHFTVPEGIKGIARNAFLDANDLTSLRLSNELIHIDSMGLIGCDKLRELDIPNGKFTYDVTRQECPNLEKVSINGSTKDISNGVLSLIINRDLKEIEFYFFNKSIEYKLNNRLSTVFKVKDNRLLLVENSDNKEAIGAIIDENFVKKFNYPELCKMFNYESLDKFLIDYEYPLDYRYDLVYDWAKIISKLKEKENNRNYFPEPEAIMAIPANKKDVYKYFLHQKKFIGFMNAHFTIGDIVSRINFTKMCYVLGAFEEGKKASESYKFIEEVLQNHHFYEISYHFGALNFDKYTYDDDYRNLLIKNWDDIVDSFNDMNYNLLNDIFQEFSNCKKQAKKEKKSLTFDYVNEYMASKRFSVREGNEALLEEVKNYHAEYSKDDFDKMQDLFEKAKEISLFTTKKIMTTVDNEKKEGSCYYKWLNPTDPSNFVLGNKVGCCAKINSVGKGILRESVTNPEVRNLALFGHKNKIIGKATAYFNTSKKYILFNNAEISEDIKDSEKEELLDALLRAVSDQVAIQNKDKINVDKVAIGMTRNDLKHQIFKKRLKIVRAGLLKNNALYANDENLYEGDASSHFEGQCILYEMSKRKGRFFS